MKKIALFLVICMLIQTLGVAAFAEEPDDPAEVDLTAEEVIVNDDASEETPAEEPADEPTEDPADEPTEDPADEPTEDPADEPAEDPADEPTEDPADEPTEDPADEPTEDPADEPTEDPADEPTEDPADEPTEEDEESEEEDEMELMSDPADFVLDGTVLMEYKGTASAVTIPSTVTEINPYCFANHKEIISITIPDTVTKIGEGAFSGCSRLTGVSLPSGVTKIEPNTFKGCTALANISWSPVTEIGENAFEGCTSLHGVALPSSVKTIQGYAFANCRGITAVDFPTGIEKIYDNAFSNCTGLAQVLLGACDSLTKIGGSAFQGCSALNRLELPPYLTEIENFAFQYCVSLTELYIPDSVEKIDREAFSGCRSLSVVYIETQVKQILTQAFDGVAGGCVFYIDSSASVMGDNCIPRGSIVFGFHHSPVDNPELYCNQNGVTFYRAQIWQFVGRCYALLLGRVGDMPGIAYWAKQLATKSLTAAACVSNFVNSAEFNARNLSNEDKVIALYRTMLDHDPDAPGLAYWKNLLDNGVSMDFLVNGFSTAPEFNHVVTGVATKYGIVAGSIKLTQARDQNADITAYVARCYRNVLNREFDVDGLNFWCGNILYNKMSGAVLVDSFVNSDEFRARGLSYEDQVEILYNTMLNRASDAAGKTDWVNYLKNYGVTIRNIINGFADAREFRILCKKYGIEPGALNNLEARDKNRLVTRFVVEVYRWTYNPGEYTPTAAELNHYAQQIISKKKTPAQIAYEFAFSQDCVERNLTNQQFVVMLYHIYLGRETDPTPAEYSPWVAKLVGGMTRQQMANAFAKVDEYTKYAKLMGAKP